MEQSGWSNQNGAVRLEYPEWISQAGVTRMEQSGWSNQNGAESILGLGSHFVSVGSSESDGTDAIIIITLIYIVR